MPNEALQKVIFNFHRPPNLPRSSCMANICATTKVLQEISQKKAFAEQQLAIVKQQKAARSREGRMLQLTSEEVRALPAETKVYEGVGKM